MSKLDEAAGRAAGGQAAADAPDGAAELLGIGAAAARLGVSERALRYYQEIGLVEPACTTPGGLRRYSRHNLARVERIRELQSLLALNLDEIAIVLRGEDRIAEISREFRDERATAASRRELIGECLDLQKSLRATVEAKRQALEHFLADLDARIERGTSKLAQPGGRQAE
jgi:DNA-binding transcriptional MerR regulator